MDRFWLTSSVEDEFIHPLASQGSQVGFVLENDTLYGVNDNHEFWSYSLNSKQFQILGKAPSNIDYITDIHNGNVFVSVMASGKKEVAELTLTE